MREKESVSKRSKLIDSAFEHILCLFRLTISDLLRERGSDLFE